MEPGQTANAFEIASTTGLPGQSPAPAASPAAPPASATPGGGDQLVEIKWNGKTEKVPLATAIELAQKGYDYTQKMQALAKDREAFGGERQRYENAIAEVRTFLQDPQRVEAYLQEMRRQRGVATPGAAAADPDTPISQAELEQRLRAAREEFAGFTKDQLAELRQTIQVETLAGQYATEIGSYVEGLKKQFPELQAIPRLDRILKDEVRAMGPKNMEEAKSMMLAVAQEHARNVQNFLMEKRKEGGGTPGAGSPLANGIEPKGGSAALPPSVQQKFKGFSDPAFREAVIADIQGR